MISSGRHPEKEIADALRRAKQAGLSVEEVHRGHRWGKVICAPCSASFAVWSTPRSAGTHAKQIDRFTAQHAHPRPASQPSGT